MKKIPVLLLACLLGGVVGCGGDNSSTPAPVPPVPPEPTINLIDDLSRDNPFVRYHGRNVHLGNKVIMNNIGSGFEVNFYGTELRATMTGEAALWYNPTSFAVLLDGETDVSKHILELYKGETELEYCIVEGLEEGYHTVKVLKRSEALSTSSALINITTDGHFLEASKERRLRLEAYGDSITCGYGNLRGDMYDQSSATLQDGLQTWATYTATALNADINVQSRTGIGLISSSGYDDSDQTIHVYKNVNYDKEYTWNFKNYIPDIVMINLGTNDQWNGVARATFVQKYKQFLNELADLYGENTSFILTYGFMEKVSGLWVEQVKGELMKDTSFKNLVFTQKFAYGQSKGADEEAVKNKFPGHPLISEHKVASNQVVQLIRDNRLNRVDEDPEPITPTATNKLTLEIMDDFKGSDTIKAYGIGDNEITLTRFSTNRLIFTSDQSIADGTYSATFKIDGKDKYVETGLPHIITVNSGNNVYVKANSFIATPSGEDTHPDTAGWFITNRIGKEYISNTTASTVSVLNTSNWMAGFVLQKTIVGDNYKLSAHMNSHEKYKNPTSLQNGKMALVPYYHDTNNFLVVYLQFTNVGVIYSVGVTGYMEGVDLGWNDCFSLGNVLMDFDNGMDLAVTRQGTKIIVDFNGKTETKEFPNMVYDTNYMGVYGYGDETVDFTNYVCVSGN